MSGHSKWSKIKRKKEAKDIIKGNVFSKLSRLITLAVIEGGGITDPQNNVRLRLAVDKARSLNMPKDNIERAIENGTKQKESQMKEVLYEGFAPGGVAILILATTDNPNRTLAEIRNVVEKKGGKLGSRGSVSYLFRQCCLLELPKSQTTEDTILSIVSQLEAFDLNEEKENYLIYFPLKNLTKLRKVVGDLQPLPVETIFQPVSFMPVDEKTLVKIDEMIDELENLDDVHGVYENYQL